MFLYLFDIVSVNMAVSDNRSKVLSILIIYNTLYYICNGTTVTKFSNYKLYSV